MRDDWGPAPLVPLKLTSVVNVCAGEAIAVAAQNTKAMQTIFDELKWKLRGCCMGFPPEKSSLGSGPDCSTVLYEDSEAAVTSLRSRVGCGAAGAANSEHPELAEW